MSLIDAICSLLYGLCCQFDGISGVGGTDGTVDEEFDDTEAIDGSRLTDVEEEDDGFGVADGQDSIQSHLVMQQWPVGGDGAGHISVSSGLLGQVSGVDVNGSGMVYVFHRGPRVWDYMLEMPRR